jgi:uncharacterized protein (TIGR02300 family)
MAGLLTAADPCGKARPDTAKPSGAALFSFFAGVPSPMVKAEWGTKRTCPKCATRFYDLGKDDPVTCLECGVNWEPEPVLKSKQPMPFDAPKKEVEKEAPDDADLAADELEIDEDAEENPDDEVDLGGDDDIGVPGSGDEDEEI